MPCGGSSKSLTTQPGIPPPAQCCRAAYGRKGSDGRKQPRDQNAMVLTFHPIHTKCRKGSENRCEEDSDTVEIGTESSRSSVRVLRSRKSHSFLHEYPRIRVDRFTESRERIPSFLKRPLEGSNGLEEPGPWEDLASGTDETIPDYFPNPTIQLLSHIHLDHLEGLNTPSHNGSPIYCSYQTKKMLLRLELGSSRAAGEADVPMGVRGRKRPYEWLRLTQREAETRMRETGRTLAPRDLLHPLPLNTPTTLSYLPGYKVRITLLDANHMPGAVMFLVEGHRGAVLHTGDCRAEKWWLDSLVRNPVMQPYVSWEGAKAVAGQGEEEIPEMRRVQSEFLQGTQVTPTKVSRSSTPPQSTQKTNLTTPSPGDFANAAKQKELRLRNIYIDDEAIKSAEWPLPKKDAAIELIRLLERYPQNATFFLDMWTWGYEEIYMAIGKSLQTQGKGSRVHVDSYKRSMYKGARDVAYPFLTVQTHTRFHACERRGDCAFLSEGDSLAAERKAFDNLSQDWTGPAPLPLAATSTDSMRQDEARQSGAHFVVYVKPISSSRRSWAELSQKLHAEIDLAQNGQGEFPSWLACPIDRHSALPELQRFVRAFRPATVTPTTSNESHYFLTAKYLGPALGPGGQARVNKEARGYVADELWNRFERAASSSTAPNTVADEIRCFKENLRETLDLSQDHPLDLVDERARGHANHATDTSTTAGSLPSRTAREETSMEKGQQNWSRQALPATQAVTVPDHSSRPVNVAGNTSTTQLDEDLARRYFIVLRMFIEPGLRLKNLPGNTEGPLAWRAVRKLRPDYARATEETMYNELGIVPPSWTDCVIEHPFMADINSLQRHAPTFAPATEDARHSEGVNGPTSDPVLKSAVEDYSQMADMPLTAETRAAGRISNKEAEPSPFFFSSVNPTPTNVTATEADIRAEDRLAHSRNVEDVASACPDWLMQIAENLCDDWSPVPLQALRGASSDDSALNIIRCQAKLYDKLLARSLRHSGDRLRWHSYSHLICPAIQKAFGALSTAVVQNDAQRQNTSGLADHENDQYAVLFNLASMCELAARVCAMMLSREARYDALEDDGERARMRSTLSSTERFASAFERKLASACQTEEAQDQHNTGHTHQISSRILQIQFARLLATLRFASDEAVRTELPRCHDSSASDRSQLELPNLAGWQEQSDGNALAQSENRMAARHETQTGKVHRTGSRGSFRVPHARRSIRDRSGKRLRFHV